MRVISGKYKGKKLKGFTIEGTRPTMDRVKESLLATVEPFLQNKTILDLYAGSGSLGIEALSLGAKEVTFVDRNKIAYQTILENTDKMENCEVLLEDAFRYMKKTEKTFDIIFLDPPYDANLLQKTIDTILKYQLLKEDGLLICEYEKENFSAPLPIWKEKKYGTTHIRIYKK